MLQAFLGFLQAAMMRVASYNLRFDSSPDNITVQQTIDSLTDPLHQPPFLKVTTEKPWSTRRIRVSEAVLSEGVAIAGFQEALSRQVKDLAELFGQDWSWIGVGRDDGDMAGEFVPIFFRNDMIKLVSHDYFWLSNTPFEPSKFPGAGSRRICTVGQFSLSTAGASNNFTLLNAHLDDQSDAQRRLAASLLLTRARFEAVRTKSPVFLTGDFNSSPTGYDAGAYNITTGKESPVPINSAFAGKYAVAPDQLPDFKMIDLCAAAPRKNVSANFATYTGFKSACDIFEWSRIDFIFGGGNMGWMADRYKVGTSLSDDGLLASDHRPVFADVSF